MTRRSRRTRHGRNKIEQLVARAAGAVAEVVDAAEVEDEDEEAAVEDVAVVSRRMDRKNEEVRKKYPHTKTMVRHAS